MKIKRKEAEKLFEKLTGRRITFSGLYSLAYRRNFLIKEPGRIYEKIFFDREKMIECLSKKNKKIPKGYMTITQLIEKYNCSGTFIYNIVCKLDHVKFGNKTAYKEKDFLAVYNKRKEK